MQDVIRNGLVARFPARLVDEPLAAYADAKRNFYLGGLRLSAVEGGRFCEAAFPMLQHVAFGAYDKLGMQLNTQNLMSQLESAKAPDSVSLHIPRALRAIYDTRNKRALHTSTRSTEEEWTAEERVSISPDCQDQEAR